MVLEEKLEYHCPVVLCYFFRSSCFLFVLFLFVFFTVKRGVISLDFFLAGTLYYFAMY